MSSSELRPAGCNSGILRPDQRTGLPIFGAMRFALVETRFERYLLPMALVFGFGFLLAKAPAAETRPNILFAIADDWSYPHAGAYGDRVVRTPTFDRVAREGALFRNAFCAAPSCTPSRGAILTGRFPHQLEEGGNLWGILPKKYRVYPDILEESGYFVGHMRKGWGPGTLEGSGRTRNPAGPAFKSFQQFLRAVPTDRPFCFWFGSVDPHRPYEPGSGAKAGLKAADVVVPAILPDAPAVRDDVLDYYAEVQRFDREVGELLELLQQAGRLQNTIVVITSDNGMPFPRAKANLTETGIHVPLAIRWPGRIKPGQKLDALVSLADMAPTFLAAAGVPALAEMTGKSLLGLVTGGDDPPRRYVFVERERHANVRAGDRSYPCRAVRTQRHLYVRNLRPELWPAGDPQTHFAVGPFGDVDPSPTKDWLLARRDDPQFGPFARRAFDKRPAEELYDLVDDPGQQSNLAGRPEQRSLQAELRQALDEWMQATGDPRAAGDTDFWDRAGYFGAPERPRKPTP